MQPFSYATADSAADASTKAKEANAALLGGGTCLIDLMKLNVMAPETLIDARRIASGTGIQDNGKTVMIAGTTSNSDVAHNALIQKEFPVLSEAILSGASPQLRNAATVAGNLMQRTRCLYFRDTSTACNKRKPGSGCDAIDGFNRINAVLGGSKNCIATNPSDMNVALVALDAVVHIQQADGTIKQVPAADFHTLPGDHPEIETVLQPGDVIVGVELTKSSMAQNSHYLKVRDRASFSFALTSAAIAMNIENGVFKDARLALGGVGTKPWRAVDAEKALIGKKANRETYKAAADVAMRAAVPQKYNKFKIELAKRTIVKAYEEAVKA